MFANRYNVTTTIIRYYIPGAGLKAFCSVSSKHQTYLREAAQPEGSTARIQTRQGCCQRWSLHDTHIASPKQLMRRASAGLVARGTALVTRRTCAHARVYGK